MTVDPGHARRIAATFVEFANAVGGRAGEPPILGLLAERSVQRLDLVAARVALISGDGRLVTVASAALPTSRLRGFAAGRDPGPAAGCARTGLARRDVDLAASAHRWPGYAAAARAAGVTAVSVIPLRARGRCIGVLTVAGPGRGHVDEVRLSVAQALADAAAAALLAQRDLLQVERVAGQLRYALDSRIVIEQAKGILAERWQVGVDEAFAALREAARRQHARLQDAARAVVEGTWCPGTEWLRTAR